MLEITSQPNGWELSSGSLKALLELSRGRLRLHVLGASPPPMLLSSRYASDPFPDRLWFDQSILMVSIDAAKEPVRWTVNVEGREADRLTLDLTGECASLTARLVVRSPRSGALIVEGSVAVTRAPVLISDAVSMALSVPDVEQQLYLHGRWGAECQQQLVPAAADLLLESRSGKTGFEYQPYLALLCQKSTSIIQVSCPGNWFLRSREVGDHVTVTAGLNSWGLRHTINVGKPLNFPRVTLIRVDGDLNVATQLLHEVQRDDRPRRDRPIPVQFNSWYPYQGEPNFQSLLELVPLAAQLGCQFFVLDAGWHTNAHSLSDEFWWLRTGDWITAQHLFPDGLPALSSAVRDRGMEFGIWFEPEAVGPGSQIVVQGLPWLHAIPGDDRRTRERDDQRTRKLLHLGVEAAREAIRDKMIAVIAETGARWMKWDFNTDLSQGGWPATVSGQPDPLVAHYEGLVRLQAELLEAFPELLIEMCAGGGGRSEPGILKLAATSWMSDQTQAVTNLAIHLGAQLAQPPELCNDWLIEWPPHDTGAALSAADQRGDLTFRTHVAMLGAFGISAPLQRWNAAEFTTVANSVAWYRQHQQHLLPRSKQFLLGSAPSIYGETDWGGAWYASQDASHGTALLFRLDGPPDILAQMPALDPSLSYVVHGLPGKGPETLSGAELEEGVIVRLDQPHSSAAISVVQE